MHSMQGAKHGRHIVCQEGKPRGGELVWYVCSFIAFLDLSLSDRKREMYHEPGIYKLPGTNRHEMWEDI